MGERVGTVAIRGSAMGVTVATGVEVTAAVGTRDSKAGAEVTTVGAAVGATESKTGAEVATVGAAAVGTIESKTGAEVATVGAAAVGTIESKVGAEVATVGAAIGTTESKTGAEVATVGTVGIRVSRVVGVKIARGSATVADMGTVTGFNASAKLRAGEADGAPVTAGMGGGRMAYPCSGSIPPPPTVNTSSSSISRVSSIRKRLDGLIHPSSSSSISLLIPRDVELWATPEANIYRSAN